MSAETLWTLGCPRRAITLDCSTAIRLLSSAPRSLVARTPTSGGLGTEVLTFAGQTGR